MSKLAREIVSSVLERIPMSYHERVARQVACESIIDAKLEPVREALILARKRFEYLLVGGVDTVNGISTKAAIMDLDSALALLDSEDTQKPDGSE